MLVCGWGLIQWGVGYALLHLPGDFSHCLGEANVSWNSLASGEGRSSYKVTSKVTLHSFEVFRTVTEARQDQGMCSGETVSRAYLGPAKIGSRRVGLPGYHFAHRITGNSLVDRDWIGDQETWVVFLSLPLTYCMALCRLLLLSMHLLPHVPLCV